MIVAIVNRNAGSARNIVANSLALLRARSGRKVMLIDTAPQPSPRATNGERTSAAGQRALTARAITGRGLSNELELLRLRYNDIVITTEERDTTDSRAALISARLVVVPVTPDQVDLASQYQLIARLNAARMFNPGLRVLFVIVAGRNDPGAGDMAAVRAYVTQVMAATLAHTVLHTAGAQHGAGGHAHYAPDAPDCDPHAALEMSALYKEIFTA
ncbi:MAG: hypothetical protein V4724_28295 [Pseudomonadota bacterium]